MSDNPITPVGSHRLVRSSLLHGAVDNITVILIRLSPLDEMRHGKR